MSDKGRISISSTFSWCFPVLMYSPWRCCGCTLISQFSSVCLCSRRPSWSSNRRRISSRAWFSSGWRISVKSQRSRCWASRWASCSRPGPEWKPWNSHSQYKDAWRSRSTRCQAKPEIQSIDSWRRSSTRSCSKWGLLSRASSMTACWGICCVWRNRWTGCRSIGF